ncbi:hypothetical protein AB1Y20_011350 [Prymnesium parvum]|uniref:Nucleolar complex protein 3 homolog n=1 Tax=Prymnesium parvum TaxID=97485 RepID=A0AB34IP34_PRYPA
MVRRKRERKEVEPDFEARPRLLGKAKDERDLLPVKEAGGKWKFVKGKHNKASRRAAGEEEEGEEGGEREAEPEGVDEAARQAELQQVARRVEEDAAMVAAKKVSIARLGRRIVEAPYKNVGLLKDLLDMANRDRSPVVQRLALLSCISSLLDVMPAYRIRLPTEKELAMQVSAEVAKLRDFEKKFLVSYEGCLGTLTRWLKSPLPAHRVAAVRAVCEMLKKGYDFNFRDDLISTAVSLSRAADEKERSAACAALKEMFGADVFGEATLLAVKAMSALLKHNSFNVPEDVLECWLHLKLDGAALEPPLTKKMKKKKQSLDPVARELAQAAGERGNRARVQAQILEQVFVAYARVVKNGAHSPLLAVALKGVAQYAHQVNVDLLLDLFTNMRALLSPTAGLSTAASLQCVHALLRLLAGHGQALNVDTKDVQVRLYGLLIESELIEKPPLLATALDCLEHLCTKSRSSLLPARSASIARRLLSIACIAPHAQAIAILCVVSRLIMSCPRIATMLQPAEAGGATFSWSGDIDLEDPDGTVALRTTAWHLALLQRHYHPTVRTLSSKLAETLPPRFISCTPLKLIANFDQASGNFQPPPPQPKPHRFALALKEDPTAVKVFTAAVSSSIPEVRDAAATSMAAAERPCDVSFLGLANAILGSKL